MTGSPFIVSDKPSPGLKDVVDIDTSSPRPSIDLPLEDFVPRAKAWAVLEREKARKRGEWRSSTWDIARCLKGHPELSALTEDELLDKIDLETLGLSSDELEQLVYEWAQVKHIPGGSWLAHAVELSTRYPPLSFGPGMGGGTPLYMTFINLAGCLQETQGRNGTILLPCRRIGDLLGCDKNTVSAMRRRAEKAGLLKVVRAHSSKRATRYFFDYTRFADLTLRIEGAEPESGDSREKAAQGAAERLFEISDLTPPSAQIGLWIKKFGAEFVVGQLEELTCKALLDRPNAYIYKVLKNSSEENLGEVCESTGDKQDEEYELSDGDYDESGTMRYTTCGNGFILADGWEPAEVLRQKYWSR